MTLQQELLDETYMPEPYRSFTVHEINAVQRLVRGIAIIAKMVAASQVLPTGVAVAIGDSGHGGVTDRVLGGDGDDDQVADGHRVG